MPDKIPKNIRPLNRYITTHNDAGQAIFSSILSEVMPVQRLPDSADFSLAYTSDHFPAQLNNESDITEYNRYLSSPPESQSQLVPSAASLDYGVVLEGEVELVLDSGETRLLKRGDVAVQRGTNHAWRNVTPDAVVDGVAVPQWARMLYVLAPAQEMEIGGKKLGEVVDGIGVRAST
ncbi:uncharacterized protein N7477_009126 [Penicillium maclennaniae]|uniref:uncharacterized protein n=1 Tax=Penicillium maclennaniae TaxID=1343394 RepID=UPI00253F71EF|nr:uncharacterized protein N7477_009126 [Penicillium maclennaniae]KAJ5661510.1 hypothetical protein N7477_009126 [Penicillium maclennaniae]